MNSDSMWRSRCVGLDTVPAQGLDVVPVHGPDTVQGQGLDTVQVQPPAAPPRPAGAGAPCPGLTSAALL